MCGRVLALAAAALLLVACTASEPEQGRREATPLPAGRTAQPPARQVLRANWDFESGAAECVATAASGRTSLQVTVRRNAPVRLSVSFGASSSPAARSSVRLRFKGAAGSWQVSAQPVANRQLAATLGAGDAALSRVIVLLSGGVVDIGESEDALPSINLPSSDARGQSWFDCTRDKMI